jgi:hypothetical protein
MFLCSSHFQPALFIDPSLSPTLARSNQQAAPRSCAGRTQARRRTTAPARTSAFPGHCSFREVAVASLASMAPPSSPQPATAVPPQIILRSKVHCPQQSKRSPDAEAVMGEGGVPRCRRMHSRLRLPPKRPVPADLRDLCFNCFSPVHRAAQCRSRHRCFKCRSIGHLSYYCFGMSRPAGEQPALGHRVSVWRRVSARTPSTDTAAGAASVGSRQHLPHGGVCTSQVLDLHFASKVYVTFVLKPFRTPPSMQVIFAKKKKTPSCLPLQNNARTTPDSSTSLRLGQGWSRRRPRLPPSSNSAVAYSRRRRVVASIRRPRLLTGGPSPARRQAVALACSPPGRRLASNRAYGTRASSRWRHHTPRTAGTRAAASLAAHTSPGVLAAIASPRSRRLLLSCRPRPPLHHEPVGSASLKPCLLEGSSSRAATWSRSRRPAASSRRAP